MPAWLVSKSEDSVCFILLACLQSQLLLKVTYLCPCTTLGFTARIFDIASKPRYFTTKENQCSQSKLIMVMSPHRYKYSKSRSSVVWISNHFRLS